METFCSSKGKIYDCIEVDMPWIECENKSFWFSIIIMMIPYQMSKLIDVNDISNFIL